MTTYSLSGFVTHFNADGGITGVDQVSLNFVDLDAGTSNLKYQTSFREEDNLPEVLLNLNDFHAVTIRDHANIRDAPGIFGTYLLGEIHWSGNVSYTFQYLFERDEAALYTFTLGGTALPDITTIAQVNAFNALVTAGNVAPDGTGYAPGEIIDITSIVGITVSEDDDITVNSDSPPLSGGIGNDTFHYYGDLATLDGGAGSDTIVFEREQWGEVTELSLVEGGLSFGFFLPQFDSVIAHNVETFQFEDGSIFSFTELRQAASNDAVFLVGDDTDETLTGDNNDDRLVGNGGNDTLYGMDGADTLNGGAGDDFLFGGETSSDLRDTIYGLDGNDTIDGGYGNDLLHGMEGNDNIQGGFGADTIFGGEGNDILNGGALSDVLIAVSGDNFFNGGFGFDRITGGIGSDNFYHLGVANHGTDWIAEYYHRDAIYDNPASTDTLVFGQAGASASDFHVNFANTTGAGSAEYDEAFVTYLPTGQIIWAIVDAEQVDEIYLQISGSTETFDLLA